MFVCGRSEQDQHLWRHFGVMNLSKNSDVLQLVERLTFMRAHWSLEAGRAGPEDFGKGLSWKAISYF